MTDRGAGSAADPDAKHGDTEMTALFQEAATQDTAPPRPTPPIERVFQPALLNSLQSFFIHLCFLILYLSVALLGCSGPAEPPDPDGTITGPNKLTILSPPGRDIGLVPGESITLKIRYTDHTGDPLANGEILFAMRGETGGSTLAQPKTVTDQNGIAQMLLMAGYEESFFDVDVTAVSAPSVKYNVAVSDAGFGSLIVYTDYEGMHQPEVLKQIQASLYLGRTCTELKMSDPIIAERVRFLESLQDNAVFGFLPLSSSYAVTVVSRSDEGKKETFGCKEIRENALKPNAYLETIIPMTDLVPNLSDLYEVRSEVVLPSGENGSGQIMTALRPWTFIGECDYGCGESFLDCLQSALENPETDPEDLTCGNTIPTNELGLKIEDLRGQKVARCRSGWTESNSPSLEKELQESVCREESTAKLQALAQTESLALLRFTIYSLMSFRSIGVPGQWVADHVLKTARFYEAFGIPSVDIQSIGAPITIANSILIEKDPSSPMVLLFEEQGFSIKLGRLLLQVLNSHYLEAPIPSVRSGLERLLSANSTDTESACTSIDKIVCSKIQQPEGCLEDACESAMIAWAHKLETGLLSIDPAGKDLFFLGGEVTMMDMNQDLEAEKLGSIDAPGFWDSYLKTSTDDLVYLEIPFIAVKPIIPVN